MRVNFRDNLRKRNCQQSKKKLSTIKKETANNQKRTTNVKSIKTESTNCEIESKMNSGMESGMESWSEKSTPYTDFFNGDMRNWRFYIDQMYSENSKFKNY